MILTFFQVLIACVGFPAAMCLLRVYLASRTQEVFLWLSLLIIIYPQIFLDELLWGKHLICALRCEDAKWCERKAKGFFLVSWLSNVPPAICEVTSKKQKDSLSLPAFLHLFCLCCAAETPERGPECVWGGSIWCVRGGRRWWASSAPLGTSNAFLCHIQWILLIRFDTNPDAASDNRCILCH